MKKIIYVFPLLVLLAAGCNPQQKTGNQSNTNEKTVEAPASQKFVDQTYYKSAYLISGDTLTPQAKEALAGFDMTKKTLPDGSVEVSLKAQKSEYHDQQYTLKAGQQLYFIEKFLGDDKEGQENFIGDDSAVIVDSEGAVVLSPADWKK